MHSLSREMDCQRSVHGRQGLQAFFRPARLRAKLAVFMIPIVDCTMHECQCIAQQPHCRASPPMRRDIEALPCRFSCVYAVPPQHRMDVSANKAQLAQPIGDASARRLNTSAADRVCAEQTPSTSKTNDCWPAIGSRRGLERPAVVDQNRHVRALCHKALAVYIHCTGTTGQRSHRAVST